jgi:hypothetical protein
MFDWLSCLNMEHFDQRQSACGLEMAQMPGVPLGMSRNYRGRFVQRFPSAMKVGHC